MSEWTKFSDKHPTEDGWYWIYRDLSGSFLPITIVRFRVDAGFSHGYEYFSRKCYWAQWMKAEEPKPPVAKDVMT